LSNGTRFLIALACVAVGVTIFVFVLSLQTGTGGYDFVGYLPREKSE